MNKPTIDHGGMTYEPVESPEYIEYCEKYHYAYTMGVNTEHRVSIYKTFGYDGPFCFIINYWPFVGELNKTLPRPYVDTKADGTYLTPLNKRNNFLISMEQLPYRYPPFVREDEVWHVTSQPANDKEKPEPRETVFISMPNITPSKEYLDMLFGTTNDPVKDTETPEPPIGYKAGVDPYDKGGNSETSKVGVMPPYTDEELKSVYQEEVDILREQLHSKNHDSIGTTINHADGKYKTMSNEEFEKDLAEKTMSLEDIDKKFYSLPPILFADFITAEQWRKMSDIDHTIIRKASVIISLSILNK